MNRRFIAFAVVLASALAIGTSVIWKLEHPTSVGRDGTSVHELASCSDELPWDQPSKVETVSQKSEGLVVRVLANASCGGVRAVEPRAKIEKQNVMLSWSWYLPEGEAVAACLCTRRLEFVVPRGKALHSPSVSLSEAHWKQ